MRFHCRCRVIVFLCLFHPYLVSVHFLHPYILTIFREKFVLLVYVTFYKIVSERALATLYVRMGPVFSVLGGFDTPETRIRHVHNLILIAEMESAS